jgi:hypothetical protein
MQFGVNGRRLYKRLELVAGASAIVVGVPGYLFGIAVLDFFAVLFAVAAFAFLVARQLLDSPSGRKPRSTR